MPLPACGGSWRRNPAVRTETARRTMPIMRKTFRQPGPEVTKWESRGLNNRPPMPKPGQQDAGNKTTPARKPVDHSGQPGVIANTDARAHKDPVKKVESKKGDRTGAAQKAGYRQSDPQHQSGFLRQAGREHAG